MLSPIPLGYPGNVENGVIFDFVIHDKQDLAAASSLQGNNKSSSEVTEVEVHKVKDVKYGPRSVMKNLTRPEYYDYSKRPNAAFIHGEIQSHLPDPTYVTLHVSSVVSIDQIQQTMTTSYLEEIMWQDHRLLYNTSDEGRCVFPTGFDIVEMTVPLHQDMYEGVDRVIWTPSTDMLNVVDREFGKSYGVAHPDASLHMFHQQDVTTACPMHFGQYPFDVNTCYFDLSSFMHSDSDIALRPGGGRDNGTELIDLQYMSSFNVGQFKLSSETKTTSYIADYYTLRGEISYERGGNIFEVEIMLPDLLLHVSIYASFWIPADSPPARVALCIISALSFRLMRTSISENLPPVSYPLWIIDYMEASQVIAVLALIQYALVAYLFSIELLHESKFKQIKMSKIPLLVKNHPSKASILFKEAKLQFEEFCEEAKKAESFKGNSVAAVAAAVKRSSQVFNSNNVPTANSPKNGSVFPKDMFLDDNDVERQEKKSVDKHAEALVSFDRSIDDAILQNMIIKYPSSPTSAANGQDQNIDPPARINMDFLELDFNLTIPEVMTIAHARSAFMSYDTDMNGFLRISELKQCFRHFGKHYSTHQCCALVASYRQSQGSSFAQYPTLNLADFFCVLVELELHAPLPEFSSSDISTIPPPLLVDVIARIAYPLIVIAKIWIYFALLDTY